jgi:nucleotide-binding universal stress UspA family protein
MYSTILCATDGLEHSDGALDHAAELAALPGGELHVVHLIEKVFGSHLSGQDLMLNEAEIVGRLRARVDQITRDQHVSVTLHTPRVHAGRVGDRLATLADEIDADLIVVGTRGRSSLGSLMIGSVAQRLLHLTRRPVLVVPQCRSVPPTRTHAGQLEHAI